jgi:GT2 family glycosyltransferase
VSAARVAAMVLARDRPEVTQETVDAVLAQQPPVDAVLLVANAATAEVRAVLDRAASADPRVEVLALEENRGCAGGNEAGIARLLERGDLEYVCGFDDDATPAPGCIAALVAAAEALPDLGVAGAVAHDEHGTLAWPMLVDGEPRPAETVAEVRALATRRPGPWPVPNVGWQGKLIPLDVLRRHGNVWGALFLQYEDVELGLRLRRAGLRTYLVPGAECEHPAPPRARVLRLLGRQIEITAQTPAKEYLTLRNALVVRPRYDGARFWYGSGALVLLRGLLSTLALDVPRLAGLRHVFLRGIADAVRGRLGPPPPEVTGLRARPASPGTPARSPGSSPR